MFWPTYLAVIEEENIPIKFPIQISNSTEKIPTNPEYDH